MQEMIVKGGSNPAQELLLRREEIEESIRSLEAEKASILDKFESGAPNELSGYLETSVEDHLRNVGDSMNNSTDQHGEGSLNDLEESHQKAIRERAEMVAPDPRDVFTKIISVSQSEESLNKVIDLVSSGVDVNIRDKRNMTALGCLAKSVVKTVYSNRIPPEESQRRTRINNCLEQLIRLGAIVRREDLNFNIRVLFEGEEHEQTVVDDSCGDTKIILQKAFDSQPFVLRSKFFPNKNEFDLDNALFLAEMSNLVYSSEETILTAGATGCSYVITSENQKFRASVTADQDKIIISFRGTENLENWKRNVYVRLKKSEVAGDSGRIHTGFDSALSQVWDNILEKIQQLRDKFSRDIPHIWFTGHSLGGAMAILAADRYTNLHRQHQ